MAATNNRTENVESHVERGFDSRTILIFLGGALLLTILAFFIGSKLFSSFESRMLESNSSQTQESDKRAVP